LAGSVALVFGSPLEGGQEGKDAGIEDPHLVTASEIADFPKGVTQRGVEDHFSSLQSQNL
jgi:hypothetical protein